MLIRSVQIPVKPEAGQHAEFKVYAALRLCKIGHSIIYAVVLAPKRRYNFFDLVIEQFKRISEFLFKIFDGQFIQLIAPKQMPQQIVQLRALAISIKFTHRPYFPSVFIDHNMPIIASRHFDV